MKKLLWTALVLSLPCLVSSLEGADVQGFKKDAAQGCEPFVGPPGLVGPGGPQGPAGPVGATGVAPAGPVGSTGIQGPQGVQGLAGSNGAEGPAGGLGPQGLPGTQGLTGVTGAPGITGASPVGAAGSTGAVGSAGPVGNQGPQGIQGADGNQGPQGLPGLIGNAGSPGVGGVGGITGVTGLTGVTTLDTLFTYSTVPVTISLLGGSVPFNGTDVSVGTAVTHSNVTNNDQFNLTEAGSYRVIVNTNLVALTLLGGLGIEVNGTVVFSTGNLVSVGVPIILNTLVEVNAPAIIRVVSTGLIGLSLTLGTGTQITLSQINTGT